MTTEESEDDLRDEFRRDERWQRLLTRKRQIHWHPNDPDYAEWHGEPPEDNDEKP